MSLLRRVTGHEPVRPPDCDGLAPPKVPGIHRDRETGQWFTDSVDTGAGHVPLGPFVTEDEARAALLDLMR